MDAHTRLKTPLEAEWMVYRQLEKHAVGYKIVRQPGLSLPVSRICAGKPPTVLGANQSVPDALPLIRHTRVLDSRPAQYLNQPSSPPRLPGLFSMAQSRVPSTRRSCQALS
jgi:hypothetical protein